MRQMHRKSSTGIWPRRYKDHEFTLTAPAERTGVEGEQADVAYPCVVDEKTLFACLQTAEQVFRKPDEPTRLERFRRTKAKLFAQAKASHLPPVSPSDSARRAAKELAAMFTELSNCYTASKCAATDREESLRLRGMAEAYADAARRCQEFPARRRNDGTLVTFAAAPADNDAESLLPELTAVFVTNAIRVHTLSNHGCKWHDCLADVCYNNKELIQRARGEREPATTKGDR